MRRHWGGGPYKPWKLCTWKTTRCIQHFEHQFFCMGGAFGFKYNQNTTLHKWCVFVHGAHLGGGGGGVSLFVSNVWKSWSAYLIRIHMFDGLFFVVVVVTHGCSGPMVHVQSLQKKCSFFFGAYHSSHVFRGSYYHLWAGNDLHLACLKWCRSVGDGHYFYFIRMARIWARSCCTFERTRVLRISISHACVAFNCNVCQDDSVTREKMTRHMCVCQKKIIDYLKV